MGVVYIVQVYVYLYVHIYIRTTTRVRSSKNCTIIRSTMDYTKIHDDKSPSWILFLKRRLSNKQRSPLLKDKKYTLLLSCIVIYVLFFSNLLSSGSNGSKSRVSGSPDDVQLSSNLKYVSQDLHKTLNQLPSDANLRDKLTYYFPYEPSKPIPNSIWQTWKVPVNDPAFPMNFKSYQASWDEKNPGYNHQIIPDTIIDEFLYSIFQNIPEVIEAYNLLPKNILKADFFRYLIIYARGGTYSDIDTVCLKPIESWATFDKESLMSKYLSQEAELHGNLKLQNNKKALPRINAQSRHSAAGLIIGIEADPDRVDWSDWYARRIQFCQWTIQGKKGHPMLRELIIRIVEQTKRKQKMNKLNSVEGKDAGGDIMQWTGPGIFTDVLFDYLNNVLTDGKQKDGFGVGSQYWVDNEMYKLKKLKTDRDGNEIHNEKQFICWKAFSNLEDPKLIDDILVLPITSFSPDVGQMGAKSHMDPMAFVKHQFEGSWKPENER